MNEVHQKKKKPTQPDHNWRAYKKKDDLPKKKSNAIFDLSTLHTHTYFPSTYYGQIHQRQFPKR